ncbi:hypothetical protein HYV81_04555 [Candidatus Woesearchaeota archaeon]|nr:hypothetical protein [Candidatus Woesearchaeota archaeon]
MTLMTAEIGERRDERLLEDSVDALIGQTTGASSDEKFVTRIMYENQPFIDIFGDSAQVYIRGTSPKMPDRLRRIVQDKEKIEGGSDANSVVADIENEPGITKSIEMVRRIGLLGKNIIDVYRASRQVHVRVPSSRLPDILQEVLRLYQHEGYGISGGAPSAGFF